jgi:hypothetical protein
LLDETGHLFLIFHDKDPHRWNLSVGFMTNGTGRIADPQEGAGKG